jgi:hypothetical protein
MAAPFDALVNQRRTRGKLDDGDQIALVLGRDEAGRGLAELVIGQP